MWFKVEGNRRNRYFSITRLTSLLMRVGKSLGWEALRNKMDDDRSDSNVRLVFIFIVAPLLVWFVTFDPLCLFGWREECKPTIEKGAEISIAPTPSTNEVVIYFESASTKEDWINAVTEDFNSNEVKTSSGQVIFVTVQHGNSGGSQQAILDGEKMPVMWSPGDQSWIDGANQVWQDIHGKPLIPDECPQSVLAPIGIGMWRPMAEALGWPDQPISWETLVALANNPEGWGSYGHPEWGQFKFGHTHPDFSNSGMLTMTALAYDALGQTDNLTFELAKSQPVVDAMRDIEQITYHYGRQSRTLATKMIERGASYLHATNITEAELLRLNGEYAGQMDFPLAFIFPAGGTFWTEQPLCILDGDWVTNEQQEAARLYRDFLLAAEQQARVVDFGLRPVSPDIPLHAPIALENGTDPSVTPDTVPALPSPSTEVVQAISDVFHDVKKKATIIVVLDISGSMQGDKISSARDATSAFVSDMARDDRITVFAFNSTIFELVPSGRAGDVKEELATSVSNLFAQGGTALFDAVCNAVTNINEQKAVDLAAEERRLYGVVVLSDGDDTMSRLSENDMFNCLPTGEDVEGIKVFTIAYGEDADVELLKRIANRTNGVMYEGDPESLQDVYLAISAEQ